MKIVILFVVLIASSFICYMLAHYAGRLGWMRPGKPKFFIPMLLLAVIGVIPIFLYFPHVPLPPDADGDTMAWIAFASFGMNLHGLTDGLKSGHKRRVQHLS